MEKKKYIVACESARFKGITGKFGRVAIPTFKSGIEREKSYLKRSYDCETLITVTPMVVANPKE